MMNESCFAYIKYYQLTHATFFSKYPCSHFNEPLPPALHYGTHPCGPTKKHFGLIECKFAKLHVITQATKTSKYVRSAPNFTKKCEIGWIAFYYGYSMSEAHMRNGPKINSKNAPTSWFIIYFTFAISTHISRNLSIVQSIFVFIRRKKIDVSMAKL